MESSSPSLLLGAEPLSHVGASTTGVLVLHGFTGSPSSVRPLAEAMAVAGYHVESPLLPGHGTSVDDMRSTTWADWLAAVDAARSRLEQRCARVVIVGQSMGGSLALRAALDRPTSGLICINPATRPQDATMIEMVEELVEDGVEVAPSAGSDIADPDAVDVSYDATPLRPLLSFMRDGLAPITDRFGELDVPLLLFTSRQDHVIDPAESEHLAAMYGGVVEHVWLERSYHVATCDHDRDLIVERSLRFTESISSPNPS